MTGETLDPAGGKQIRRPEMHTRHWVYASERNFTTKNLARHSRNQISRNNSPRRTQSGRAATKAGMISRKDTKTRRKETFSELCALASWREKIRVRKNLRKPRKFAVIVVRRPRRL